jgi:Bacterial antitoxin of type II TA system, VapB
MKTTVEIDEAKLMRLMKLTGLSTRKAALDYALNEAEKKSRLISFESKPFYVTNEPVVVEGYDVVEIRNKEVKHRARRR